ININSRTRQQSRMLFRYKRVFEKQLPVVFVLEKHRMRALERQPIQGFHHPCHPTIADERGPEPRNIVDHWNTASVRRQRAVDVGLDGIAKEYVGSLGAEQVDVPHEQSRITEGVRALLVHAEGDESTAEGAKPFGVGVMGRYRDHLTAFGLKRL